MILQINTATETVFMAITWIMIAQDEDATLRYTLANDNPGVTKDYIRCELFTDTGTSLWGVSK